MKKNLFLVIIIIISFLSCGSSEKKPIDTIKLVAPLNDQIYFAAFPDFGGAEENVTSQKVIAFNELVGKDIAWACFSDNWYNSIVYPKDNIHEVYKNGTIPYVRIMPRSDEIQGHKEEVFTMQNIIDGHFDVELRAWAKEAKKDNIPLFVDFAVEPNGDWFPWSGVFNGGNNTDNYGDKNYPDGPERYRDAYRHIINLFRNENVGNITWFFHYNYVSFPNEQWNQAKYYYPGDDYIDWIGFSLYGAQTLSDEWEGLEFSTILKEFSTLFNELNTNKPIALLEFGVTDFHKDGNKSVWLEDAFKTILYNPYVKFSAINIWHENWENEDETMTTIRLDSSQETLKTFQKLIKNERFVSKLRFE